MSKGNNGSNRRRRPVNHEFHLVSDEAVETEIATEVSDDAGEGADNESADIMATDSKKLPETDSQEKTGSQGKTDPQEKDGPQEKNDSQEKFAKSEHKQNKKKQMANESLRVQESEWILAQARERHKLEEEAWQHIQEEQQLLNERYRSIETELNKTREISRYHENFRNDLEEQMLALHGLSQDKLQGMKEFKNARYQGMAVAIFICSIAIAAICGWQYGITSQLTLFMGICVATEGALLSQEGRRSKAVDWICRILYMLPLPAMAGMYTCSKLWPDYLELAMSIAAVTAMVIVVIGTISYFLRNPYRVERRRAREARADLKELEQLAHKAVKKNIRSRRLQEKREARQARRDAAKQNRQTKREAAKAKRSENKADRIAARKRYADNVKAKFAKMSEDRKLAKAEQASRKQAKAEAKAQERLAKVVAQAAATTETKEQTQTDVQESKLETAQAEEISAEDKEETQAEVIPISQKEA